MKPQASAQMIFMGTEEIPLSAEEYRKRYVTQRVPHVVVSNPGEDTVRVDTAGISGTLISSVLLLPRQAILLPTMSGYRFQFVPGAYVHAHR